MNLEERSCSPISSLASDLQVVNLKTEKDATVCNSTKNLLPPVQPIPKRISVFSPENSLVVALNKSLHDQPKIQRCLFPKGQSPIRPSSSEIQNLKTFSSTNLRRTFSDFGLDSKVRKSICFDDNQRERKRPMYSNLPNEDLTQIKSLKDNELQLEEGEPNSSSSYELILNKKLKENLPPSHMNNMESNVGISFFSPSNKTLNPRIRRNSVSSTKEKLPRMSPVTWKKEKRELSQIQEKTEEFKKFSLPNITFTHTETSLSLQLENKPITSEKEKGPLLILPLIGLRDSIPFINAETVARLLNGQLFPDWKLIIVDCRYEYEFNGGHIRNAINMKTSAEVENQYIQGATMNSKVIMIFHCEFSSHRGPNLCKHLRKIDRQINFDHYPGLFYPQLYVLEGGFKNFFESYPELCEPCGYIPMIHPNHKEDLKKQRVSLRGTSSKVKRSFSTGDLSLKKN